MRTLRPAKLVPTVNAANPAASRAMVDKCACRKSNMYNTVMSLAQLPARDCALPWRDYTKGRRRKDAGALEKSVSVLAMRAM